MQPGLPWSVKGVEPEMREAAKEAAAAQGLTLGAWLNRLIAEAAGEAQPPPLAAALEPRLDYLSARLDGIEQSLDEALLALQRAAVPPAPALPAEAALPERLDARLAALEERLAVVQAVVSAMPAAASAGAADERMAGLEARLGRIEKAEARLLDRLDEGLGEIGHGLAALAERPAPALATAPSPPGPAAAEMPPPAERRSEPAREPAFPAAPEPEPEPEPEPDDLERRPVLRIALTTMTCVLLLVLALWIAYRAFPGLAAQIDTILYGLKLTS